MPPERVGILGGTFDPIHLGHLIPAMYALEHLHLDRLYLIPSAAPVHRPLHTPAPADDRLRMCRLAVQHLPRFAVSDLELRRPEPSYTVLTLEHFHSRLGPADSLFLLVGEDNLPLLSTWHRAADLPRLARLAVLPRPKKGTGSFSGRSEKVPVPFFSGRAGLGEGGPKSPIPIPSPLVPISGTDIRRLLRAGQDAAGLLPASVAAYIRDHGLYRP
ncbi:MAG: nicotinate (nicotinamide) nucleotide adenylyltransferase [Phycisphaerae bacterium]